MAAVIVEKSPNLLSVASEAMRRKARNPYLMTKETKLLMRGWASLIATALVTDLSIVVNTFVSYSAILKSSNLHIVLGRQTSFRIVYVARHRY